MYGLVGTMDGGIKGRVVDVDPVWFFGTGLYHRVAREGEGIGKSPLRIPLKGGGSMGFMIDD